MRAPQSPGWLQILRRPAGLRVLVATGCALTILAVATFGTAQLARYGVVAWDWLLLPPLLLIAAAAVLAAVVLRDPRQLDLSRTEPVVVTGAAMLLAVIGFLARSSQVTHGAAAWSQPLIAALGVVVFFAAIELTLRYRRNPAARRWLGVNVNSAAALVALAALVLLVVQIGSGAGSTAAIPGDIEPTEPAGPFLAFFFLFGVALLSIRLKRPLAASRGAARRWEIWSPAMATAAWLLLPTGAALMFFAFTREYGPALVLLVAAIAVCARERAPLPVVAVSVAGFVLGTWLIAMAGTALGYQAFTISAILHADAPAPPTLLLEQNPLTGVGYSWENSGFRVPGIGYGPDVLTVIGRETGGAGLAGVLLVFAFLFFALLRLVPSRAEAPIASALGFGLACFLGAQIVLALLITIGALFPVGIAPPLLAGGAPDFIAVLAAVGISIGLSWRTAINPANSGPQKPSIGQSREFDGEVTTA